MLLESVYFQGVFLHDVNEFPLVVLPLPDVLDLQIFDMRFELFDLCLLLESLIVKDVNDRLELSFEIFKEIKLMLMAP